MDLFSKQNDEMHTSRVKVDQYMRKEIYFHSAHPMKLSTYRKFLLSLQILQYLSQ